ncbi:unnamed protein product [Microthlaspi erraticum]|uniref:Uncharacterized protein n=1 Tax=Microthlaspi erraticum TaxID=1685480 RepID=A0A6D2HST8_9BRAS|nr:unnamed protein product [Microthlaspi erraticum]
MDCQTQLRLCQFQTRPTRARANLRLPIIDLSTRGTSDQQVCLHRSSISLTVFPVLCLKFKLVDLQSPDCDLRISDAFPTIAYTLNNEILLRRFKPEIEPGLPLD